METKNKGNNIGVVHENSFVLFRAPRITGITGILQIQKIRVRTRQSKDFERYTRYAGNKAPRITGITGILQIQKIRVRTRQSKDSERYARYAGNKTTNEHEPKVALVNLH